HTHTYTHINILLDMHVPIQVNYVPNIRTRSGSHDQCHSAASEETYSYNTQSHRHTHTHTHTHTLPTQDHRPMKPKHFHLSLIAKEPVMESVLQKKLAEERRGERDRDERETERGERDRDERERQRERQR